MPPVNDPRPDQHPNREGGPYQDTGTSVPKPAPGGLGTGTKGDPAEAPGAGTAPKK
jgi:hypothetical protein